MIRGILPVILTACFALIVPPASQPEEDSLPVSKADADRVGPYILSSFSKQDASVIDLLFDREHFADMVIQKYPIGTTEEHEDLKEGIVASMNRKFGTEYGNKLLLHPHVELLGIQKRGEDFWLIYKADNRRRSFFLIEILLRKHAPDHEFPGKVFISDIFNYQFGMLLSDFGGNILLAINRARAGGIVSYTEDDILAQIAAANGGSGVLYEHCKSMNADLRSEPGFCEQCMDAADKNFDSASKAEWLNKGVERTPERFELSTLRYTHCLMKGKYGEAIKILEAIQNRIGISDEVISTEIAICQYKSGNLSEALVSLNKAMVMDAGYVPIYEHMMFVQHKNSDFEGMNNTLGLMVKNLRYTKVDLDREAGYYADYAASPEYLAWRKKNGF
jgi:hypothetical protein